MKDIVKLFIGNEIGVVDNSRIEELRKKLTIEVNQRVKAEENAAILKIKCEKLQSDLISTQAKLIKIQTKLNNNNNNENEEETKSNKKSKQEEINDWVDYLKENNSVI